MRQWKILTPSFDIHSEGARLKLPLERLTGRSLEGVRIWNQPRNGIQGGHCLFSGLFLVVNSNKNNKISKVFIKTIVKFSKVWYSRKKQKETSRKRNYMNKISNVIWGIVLIAIGGIWLTNSLGITHINLFFDGWWTLFIIIPSIVGLCKHQNKAWSFAWLFVGILLFLNAQNIVTFTMIRKITIPVILIIIGLGIMFQNTISTKINKRIKELNKEGLPEYAAVFSGQKVNVKETFTGANVNAVFGGVDIDLREAKISQDAIVNCSAIFGGVDLKVPNTVNVKVKSTPIFGGVSNKAIEIAQQDIPTIYVNAFCLFGGVDIK